MRPILIRMQAFGPFAGSETVDFSRLGARSFFLIHGPTGAGKTTLLDALCFALYGDTSGGEREAKAMRSDHAAPDLPTLVELEFALGADRYRVLRSPAQSRPKLRGEGLREEPAIAELHAWRDGAWQALAVRQVSRVNDRIRELIGFDGAQFRQLIVLPQGRFREVLTADSRARQGIMEKLFRTELYSRIERALKDAAAGLIEEVAQLAQQRAGILTQAQLDSSDLLTAALAEHELAIRQAEAELAQKQDEARATQTALERARKTQAELLELDQAGEALLRLEAELPAHMLLRQTLDRAAEADVIRPAHTEQQRSEQAMKAAQQAMTDAAQALQAAQALSRETAQALLVEQARAPEQELARTRLEALEQARVVLQRWQLAEAEHRSASAQLRKLEADLQRQRETRMAQQTRHEALAQHRQTQAALAEALVLRRESLEALQRRLSTYEALGLAKAEVLACSERHREAARAEAVAEAVHAEALARRAQTEQSWISGQAARLAHSLVAGEACPVCGGRDHPVPAHAGAELVSDAVLEAARAALGKAETGLSDARSRTAGRLAELRQAEARVEALSGSLGNLADQDPDSMRQSLREASLALETSEKARASLPALQSEAETLEQAREALEQSVQQTESALLQTHTQVAVLGERMQEAERAVPEARRKPGVLEAELVQARAVLTALQEAMKAAQEADRAAATQLAAREAASQAQHVRLVSETAAAQAAGQALQAALTASNFSSLEDWQAALMAQESQREARAAVARFEQQLASARDRLQRAVSQAQGLEVPNTEALEQAAQLAAGMASEALSRLAQLRGRLAELQRAKHGLDHLAANGAALQARYAVLGRMAEIANGQNPLNMSFQRYVLATLLDEVLEAASLRLLRMSRGRYELRRVTTQADRRMAGGLDLEVFDHQTGSARPANTLSGGEGFLAALSLALGLADVVQSRSGGIQLETLFIDEGFGTLDPESLDFAINTLIDLQQGGRLVGIISHVAELRERIDVRLEVKPAEKGSRLAFVM